MCVTEKEIHRLRPVDDEERLIVRDGAMNEVKFDVPLSDWGSEFQTRPG